MTRRTSRTGLTRLARPVLAALVVALSAGLAQAQVTYTESVETVGFTSIETTGTVILDNSNATGSRDNVLNVPLPFSFSFFGTSYSTCQVSANGFVSFETNNGTGAAFYTNESFDAFDNSEPFSMIAVLWADLDLNASQGQIITETQMIPDGSGGMVQAVIIEFDSFLTDFFGGGGSVSGQVVLRADNVIEVRYPDNAMVPQDFDGFTLAAGLKSQQATATVMPIPAASLDGRFSSAMTNNYTYTPVLPQNAELSGTIGVPQTIADVGDMVTLTSSVTNQGAAAGSFDVTFYLSTDATIDTTDTPLGTTNVPSLAANTTMAVSVTAALPSLTGPFFVGAIIDTQNTVSETDETDNVAASTGTFTVGFARYERSTFTGAYSSIINQTGTTEVMNLTLFTTGFDDRLVTVAMPFAFNYFGAPVTDLEISSNGWVSFDSGGTSSQAGNDMLPDSGTPNGPIACLWDDLNDNNVDSVVATRVETLTGGGQVFVVEWFKMERFGQSGNSLVEGQIRFFEGTGRIEFHYPTTGQVYSGINMTRGFEDSAGTEAYGAPNLDDSNGSAPAMNFRFDPIVPAMPDFSISDLSSSSGSMAILQNSQVTIRRNVVNQGAAATVGVTVEVYLSRDQIIDSSDVLIDSATTPVLSAGGADDVMSTVALPGSLAFGDYFLLGVVDSGNAVTETDETNNAFPNPAVVRIGLPQNYTRSVQAQAFASIADPANVVAGLNSDTGSLDEQRVTIPVPISFKFFGQAVSQVTICANGWLSFADPAPTSSFFTNPSLPVTGSPRPVVAVVWDDLLATMGSGGKVHSAVATVSGSRIWTVEFTDFGRFGGAGAGTVINAQVRFHEASGRIEIRYDTGQTWNGMNATIGIQGSDSEFYEGPMGGGSSVSAPPAETYQYDPFLLPGVEIGVPGVAAAPAGAVAGGTTQVSFSLSNIGMMDAGAFRSGIYLSTDMLIDPMTDTFLGSFAETGLTSGATVSRDLVVVIPGATPNGNYFLAVVADDMGQLSEAITGDNTSMVVPFTVGPPQTVDLAVTSAPSLTATTVVAGGNFSLTRTIDNLGGLDAPDFDVRVLASTDEYIDVSDFSLNDQTAVSINGGMSDTDTVICNLPADMLPGNYFVSVYADDDDDEQELNESNNFSPTVMLTVTAPSGADLIPVSTSLATYAGERNVTTFVATVVVLNIGDADSTDPFDLNIRASDNQAYTTSDFIIGSLSAVTQTVSAGGMQIFTVNCDLTNTSLINGENHIYGSIENAGSDPTGNNFPDSTGNRALPETFGLADSGSTVTDVRPFGQGSVGTGNSSRVYSSGQMLSFTTPPIYNNSTAAVSNVRVGLYLKANDASQFANFSTADIFIGSMTISSITAATRLGPQQVSGIIPASLAPGTYKVGIIVDDNNMIMEDEEANNGSAQFTPEITIEPNPFGTDLLVEAVTVFPTQGAPGDTVMVTRTVRNAGQNPALPFTAQVVISDDATIDGTDMPIGTINFSSGLAGNGTDGPTTLSVTIPAGLADGMYFIGVILDDGMVITELDEGNNTGSAMFEVQSGPPCDVTFDGLLNISDVQQVINVALQLPSTTPTGREDVDNNGQINVSDVQRVINGVLGTACP